MMTLDEAIIHAEEMAEFSDRECIRERFYGEKEMKRKCAEEHRQLAEWLKELNEYKKTGRWIKVGGYCTPGGDPVWVCSECGKGKHVWGIEGRSYGGDISDHQWVTCPNCGTRMEE